MPPLTQLEAGAYVAIKITPTFVRLNDFKKDDQITTSNVSDK